MNRRAIIVLLIIVGGLKLNSMRREDGDESQHESIYEFDSKFETELGAFVVASDALIASDPGYDLETVARGLGAKLANPMKGRWTAKMVKIQFKSPQPSLSPTYPFIADLIACHESVESSGLTWEKASGYLAVDTGTMSIVDAPQFKNESSVPKEIKWSQGEPAIRDDLWYSMCFEVKNTPTGGGVILGGAVSRTGKGAGSYDFFVARSAEGAVVGIKVHFVDDDGRG